MLTTYDFDPKFASSYKAKPDAPHINILINEPVIIKVLDFTAASASKFSEDMSHAHSTGQEVIPIVCDSFGGHVHALITMIDIINNATIPVATAVQGKAMSCGAILASCGQKGLRFMGEHARMMIHDVSSMSTGKAGELQASAKEIETLNKFIFSILSKNAGVDKNYFENILQDRGRSNWYMGAKEAKKHKLIDKVGLPKFKISVNMKQEFGV